MSTQQNGQRRRAQTQATLRAGGEFSNAVLNAFASHIAVLDGNGMILEVNDSWRRFALENGSESNDLTRRAGVGVDYLDVCKKGVGDWSQTALSAYEGIRAVLDGRMPSFTLEYPCYSANSERWFTMTVTPCDVRDGKGAVVAHNEITDRKRTEDELRQSQRSLALILESAHVGVWDWDLTTNEVDFSREWKSQLGYAEDEISGDFEEWRSRVHPDDIEPILAKVRNSIESCSADHNVEFRMRHKNGTWRWIQARGLVLAGTDGNPARMLGIQLDITDRKRTEQALFRKKCALERIATGEPLQSVLDEIVDLVEEQIAGSLCSILLLDEDGLRLRVGAGKNLPAEYSAAIDGLAIGPTAGSCGTAAFRGETVIVSDIAADPLWAEGKDLGLAHGLRSCWSVPIFASRNTGKSNRTGRVLGTFALYARMPSTPAVADLQIVDTAAHLAGIAIERDKAERVLRKSEERSRELVEQASDGIFVADLEGRFTAVNSAGCRALGYQPDEIVGKSIFDFVPGNEVSRLRRVKEELQQGGVHLAEWTIRRKDGSWFPAELSAKIVSGNRWQSFWRDISDRKQAELALRESEERLRTLLENLKNVAVRAYEPDGKVTFWNKASERFYGYPAADALGRDVVELLHSEQTSVAERRIMAEALSTGELPEPEIVELVRRDGSKIIVLANRILHLRPKRPLEFFCFDVDVTDKKRTEEELANRQAELIHASRLTTVGQMVAALSHEVAQPLTAIGNFAMASDQLLSDREITKRDELREYIHAILQQNQRCVAILQRLRDFSRRTRPRRSSCNIPQLLRDSAELVSNELRRQNVKVDFEVADHIPPVIADRIQLQQVVVNLLTNACDAVRTQARDRRLITIRAQAEHDAVVLAVEDRGCGIPDDVVPHLFEPFFTTKRDGMGMGLSICDSIIKDHKGRIEAFCNCHGGATFRLQLPLPGK